MDLEQINSEYLKLKQDLQMAEKQVAYFEQHSDNLIEVHLDNITILQGKAVEAKRAANEEEKQKIEQEIQKEKETVEYLKATLEKSKENVEAFKAKIEDKINEVAKDPDMQKHLNEVIQKNKERQFGQKIANLQADEITLQHEEAILQNKKVELQEEKRQTEMKKIGQYSLLQLIPKHPTLMNNLKGIIAYKTQIKLLKNELETLLANQQDEKNVDGNKGRVDEINSLISQAQVKLDSNTQNIMNYITNHGLNISKSDIDEFSRDESLPSTPQNGPYENINVEDILNKNIRTLNRHEKRIDKKLERNEFALISKKREIDDKRNEISELNGRLQQIKEVGIQPQPVQESTLANTEQVQQPTVWEDIVSSTRNMNKIPSNPQPETTPVETKPKWYQFIKRFRNWKERVKQKSLNAPEKVEGEMINPTMGADVNPMQTNNPIIPPAQPTNEIQPQEQPVQSQQPENTKPQSSKNPYYDSLRYEVVQDLRHKMEENSGQPNINPPQKNNNGRSER